MGIRVLIVDDRASFRAGARALLEAEGFSVVGEAADGVSGLRAIAELAPDLVLLDVQLPDLDGFAVIERLAEAGPIPAVVLTSSRDAAEYGSRIPESGARAFVPKGDLTGAALRGMVR